MAIKKFQNFTGGLNLNQSTDIKDNELTIAKNVFYNNSKQIQTRRGYRKFGNEIGSAPITSYFFFQRDDTLERIALCNSGNDMYEYDGTTWNSVVTNLSEFETIPEISNRRVRTDYAVYRNVVYMMDGVNPYAKYDGASYTQPGIVGITVVTFDSSTDYVEKVAHGFVDNDEVFFTTLGTLPDGIVFRRVYYVLEVDADNFQITNKPGGDPVTFTTDGSGEIQVNKLSQPRCRYIEYMADTMVAGGEDLNPITLYRTDTAQADSEDLTANLNVIGGDEQGRINGISYYSGSPVVFKDDKVYSAKISDPPNSTAIDTQTGGYSNRSIKSVGNSLVYFNERGVDTLVKRSGVDGSSAVESEELSVNIRRVMQEIQEKSYNASTGLYIKTINNYYFSFDTTGNDIPDTTMVYNSVLGAWTEYTLPSLYDFGKYIDSDKKVQYLFMSGSGGQAYEFETGFDDDGIPIESEIQTKNRDFNDPAQLKIFEWVDVTGFKQEGGQVDIRVLVDGEVESLSMVTDNQLDLEAVSGTLGVDALGGESIGVASGDDIEGLPMYSFTVRIPFYTRGANIAVNMQATGVQWILEKIRVGVNSETVQIFGYNNII